MINSQNRLILIVFVALAYLSPALRYSREKETLAGRKFVETSSTNRFDVVPDFKTEIITADPSVPSVHVASLCEMPDGKLCATWYGGSHEGARDVCIYGSTRGPAEGKSWSIPQALVSRASAAQELQRPIKKIGNAMVFADPVGKLRLIYVTVSIGGWSTSSLNLKTSRDGGRTWLPSRRLILSPFFNLSELVKNKACALSDGSWAVPIYHECLAKFPEILWINESPAGELAWSKTRLFGGRSALQPALVPLDSQNAIALCRDCSSMKKIQLTRSTDAGQNWSHPQPIALPNPDSGLDALRLSDGRILLAFNDSSTGRDKLRLALSADAGMTWSRCATLEAERGAEFSYPYLIQGRNGRIHLVYTWKRKSIKHAAFNVEWLNVQPKETLTPLGGPPPGALSAALDPEFKGERLADRDHSL